jgi:phthalate 4,5-dioxygenase reductase subunit
MTMDTTSTPAMTLLRIVHKEEIAKDIVQFELRDAREAELPPFTAGAHVSVQTPCGLVRDYSLCNDPAEREHYVIAVKREEPGLGGTASLIDDAQPGDTVQVSAPVNNFELPARANNFLFIAGGIGITPIMSMVRHLRNEPGKAFRLYYCSRSPDVTAFLSELTAPDLKGRVTIHHDDGDPSRMLDLWPVLEQRRNQEHIYCCGPRPMMEAVRDMTGHWSSAAVHFETFIKPTAPRPDDHAFKVRLARSNVELDVPVGTTILGAMRNSGVTVPSSCESGTCGTCRTRLLEGEADHRDLVLAEHEKGDSIMVCVSRARSPRLVLDR